MIFNPLLRVVAEHQANDAGGDGEDAGLRRQIGLHDSVLCSGVRHQEPRDCREDKLSKKFLLNAEHSLGMHLAKGESVTLEQLVELFDLPSQVIEALHLRYRGLSSSQRREQEPWVIFAKGVSLDPGKSRGPQQRVPHGFPAV